MIYKQNYIICVCSIGVLKNVTGAAITSLFILQIIIWLMKKSQPFMADFNA